VMATRAGARARADEQWLTTAQVAALTGYAPKTLSNMRHPGAPHPGPPWHPGPTGKPRYKRSEVVSWMTKKRTTEEAKAKTRRPRKATA
jgi:hypothetical protein